MWGQSTGSRHQGGGVEEKGEGKKMRVYLCVCERWLS